MQRSINDRVAVVLFAVMTLAVITGVPWLLTARTAAAQPAARCTATINGRDARRAASWRDAISVNADGVVPVTWQVPGDARTTNVRLEFFGRTWTDFTSSNTLAGGRWSGEIRIGDHARYGVGLYHLIISTDTCEVSFWIDVVGRYPLLTPAGAGAAALLAVGLVVQVLGIAGAVRGGGPWRALLGGIPTGVGAVVLTQQFGWRPLTVDSLTTWTIAPVAIGGVLNRSLFALFGRREEPDRGGGATVVVPDARPTAVEVGRGTGPSEVPTSTASPGSAPPAHLPERPSDTAWATRPAGSGGPAPAAPERTAPVPAPTGVPTPGGWGTPIGSVRPPGPRAPHRTVPKAAEPAVPDTVDLGLTESDAPRTAFAMLYCPEAVLAGVEFELLVGLAPEQVAGVAGGPIVRPAWSVGPYNLTVQVVADGFGLKDGDTWRHTVRVTAAHPYPQLTMYLTAEPQQESIRARSIQAIYSIDDQTVGLAVRAVAVVRDVGLLGQVAPRPQDPGVNVSMPTHQVAADLTVRIIHAESESDGRLLWSFETPHAGIQLPDAPLVSDIGARPDLFARGLVDRVNAREGQPGLYLHLKGVGRTIADQAPVEFWDVLKAVAAAVRGRPPLILLLSQESYVPWELAVLEEPLDPNAPPFLAAQPNVGRWGLGHRRPKLPPPVEVEVRAMAVVSGVYNRPGWRRLEEAEAEAASLRVTYGATPVDAATQDVLNCIAGTPEADLLHFAVHGIYDPTGVQEGLVLVDGRTLDPFDIRGATLARAPFVFLNACQVGNANQILGDYAGMAEAFLFAGASGVVAPLWSIKDSVAREIALRFYERIFADTSPAEVFRVERGAFKDALAPVSGTYLAYQFYGHPAMKLRRTGPAPGGPGP